MSESEEILTIFKKYWKTLLKWIFHIHGLPEITVDALFTRVNSIPILELESRIEDLASYKEKEIVTMCPGGGLSLAAVEILAKAGFKDVKSLKGGTDLWHKKGYPTTRERTQGIKTDTTPMPLRMDIPIKEKLSDKTIKAYKTLDARGLSCPEPILKSVKALKELDINQVLEILTTDPGSVSDIPTWARVTGQELIAFEERGPEDYWFLIKKLK
jgi:tRNA 2-thiouridine synthesizing protein A